MQVVNKRLWRPTAKDVYIGRGPFGWRGSILANQWTHMTGTQARHVVGSRAEAVACYRQWLKEQFKAGNVAVIQAVYDIPADANLVCWCAPLECHGDVVKRAWEFLHGESQTAQELRKLAGR